MKKHVPTGSLPLREGSHGHWHFESTGMCHQRDMLSVQLPVNLLVDN